jgi:hypothetical protein
MKSRRQLRLLKYLSGSAVLNEMLAMKLVIMIVIVSGGIVIGNGDGIVPVGTENRGEATGSTDLRTIREGKDMALRGVTKPRVLLKATLVRTDGARLHSLAKKKKLPC